MERRKEIPFCATSGFPYPCPRHFTVMAVILYGSKAVVPKIWLATECRPVSCMSMPGELNHQLKSWLKMFKYPALGI